jgi:hypothetical protein
MAKKHKEHKPKRGVETGIPHPAPPPGNMDTIPTDGPQFGQPQPLPDPTKFIIKHGSDSGAYKIIDATKQFPRPFPIVNGVTEPVLTLSSSLGTSGPAIVKAIQNAGQIVFHSVGDTGNTSGPSDQNAVADKLTSDFQEMDPRAVPSFFFHLGDVIYNFGESQYYYDQFYDAYRNYPAPIIALGGNHDGMVAPKTMTPTLAAFLENFCAAGQPFHQTPEAGGLARTAQIQPGVYYTLEAPFVRIIALYSNTLEDPGVISSENGTYSLSDVQLDFLAAALDRVKTDAFKGAVLIALHHPPYVADVSALQPQRSHGSSPIVLAEIDNVCTTTGVWPHAFLSGHAHNYQRFTRYLDERETPFIVAGGGGHAVASLTSKNTPTLRTPTEQTSSSNGSDRVVFENYDDQNFGYLRILVDPSQLRIEYHPANDGAAAKTPDDSVTVDLATKKLTVYTPLDGTSNSGPRVARAKAFVKTKT